MKGSVIMEECNMELTSIIITYVTRDHYGNHDTLRFFAETDMEGGIVRYVNAVLKDNILYVEHQKRITMIPINANVMSIDYKPRSN